MRVTRRKIRRRRPTGRPVFWRDAVQAERSIWVAALVVAVGFVVWAVLDRPVRPVAVVVVFAWVQVLCWLPVRVRRRHRCEQLLAAEIARGIRQLERWLAARPRA